MIHWSYFIPRLTILALVLVAAWWAQDELIRWQLRSNIESQTGASAEIGSVQADFHAGSVVIGNVRLFDPKSPKKELFRAEKITAKGNPDGLLRRYFHFPEINIEGIQVTVDGADGGELVPDKLWQKFKDRIPKEIEMGGDFDWSAILTEKPEIAAMKLLEQFDTSRLANDLKQRWPNEIKQFEQSSALIRERFERIKTLFDRAEKPEDKIQLIGSVLQELEGVDLGVQQLFSEVGQLRQKAQSDYQSLLDSAGRDRASLKNLQPPALNADRLSETLIGPEIKEQWDKTVAWGDWALSLMVPVELGDQWAPVYERFGLSPPKQVRGETIHLTALDARPELLIEKTNLTGQILFGTHPIYFNGSINQIAQAMSLGPEPTVAQFCFSGSGVPVSPVIPVGDEIATSQLAAVVDSNVMPNLYVTLSIDRLGQNEEDQLIVRCPMYRLPERTLGNPEKLAISISPGISSLDGVLMLHGEKLSGQIRVIQTGIRLAVLLPESLRSSSLQRVLQQALDSADNLTAEMFVTGTRSQPVYTFKSNIAEKVRPQLESLVRAEWDSIRQQAEAGLTAEANQAVETLNVAVRDKIEPVLNEINAQRGQWEQLLAQGTGIPLDQLLQSHAANLSPKDRERLDRFVSTPTVQALLKTQQPGTQTDPNRQLEQAIQQGADKIQSKLPGLLDRLRK